MLIWIFACLAVKQSIMALIELTMDMANIWVDGSPRLRAYRPSAFSSIDAWRLTLGSIGDLAGELPAKYGSGHGVGDLVNFQPPCLPEIIADSMGNSLVVELCQCLAWIMANTPAVPIQSNR